MITNTGKSIIAKYLIGQAPAYASFMAFGCGAEPLKLNDSLGDYSSKTALDFEMFRVPITSRGYVTEDGVPKIVLTAELPTEERYEISEIGIFSAGSNPSATTNDSRVILSFGENEIWEYHTLTNSKGLNTYTSALNAVGNDIGVIDTADPVFQTNANNPTFSTSGRLSRQERPRFLNNTILMSGSTSDMTNLVSVSGVSATGTKITFTTSLEHNLSIGDKVSISDVNPINYNLSNVSVTEKTDTTFTIASNEVGSYVSGGTVSLPRPVLLSGNHIHLTSAGVNFNRNSPLDELKLAFSVMNKDGLASTNPDRVSVIVEFSSSDSSDSGEHARFDITLGQGNTDVLNNTYDFENNRYVLVTKKLQDLPKTSAFNWADVKVVKIYSSVLDTFTISNKALADNIATLTTSSNHGFSVGSKVTVAGVDATFNGTHTITSVTSNTFSFAKTASTVPSASSAGSAQSPTSNYYVSLDAMRLENVTTINPLYGLTGYTVVKNTGGFPILKDLNTTNLSEFRFGLNVSGVV